LFKGPLSKFFQETKQWIGYQCRYLIEKRLGNWFHGRLENGLPASLPYNPHHSIGDSVQCHIIDYHIPTQHFILSMDWKKPTNKPNQSTDCIILCQLSPYAIGLTTSEHKLVYLPTFTDLNSFYSPSSSISYQIKQQIDLSSLTSYTSDQYHYILYSNPTKNSSIQSYQINETHSVTILDVLPKQLNVKLPDNSRGRIHITELFAQDPLPDSYQTLNDLYQVNQTLNVRILGTRNIEQDSKHQRPVYECSLRNSSSIQHKVGDRILAYLDKIDEKTKGYWFYLSLHVRGYVPAELISKKLEPGQCVYLTILNKTTNEKGEYFTLTMFDKSEIDDNKTVYAKFDTIETINEFRFHVKHNNELYEAILYSTDVSDCFEDFVLWNYLMNVKSPLLINGQLNIKKELWKFRNKTIRAFVKEENTEKKQLILSTRKSRLEKNHLDIIDEEIESIDQISVGDVLHGYIDKLSNRQIVLLLGSGKSIVGHVEKVVNRSLNGHLREYLDIGMVMEAIVLNVDKDKNKCQMKLTDQCIEQILSKRSKKGRLSRASSIVSEYFLFFRNQLSFNS